MKIIVLGLSRHTTQEQLLGLFKAYGSVEYCNLVMDKATGKSKGFGFVEMPDASDAEAAIKWLHAREIDGSRVRVKKAQERPSAAEAQPGHE